MKTSTAKLKLEKNGYKVITCMQGGYIAKKNNVTVMADTINGLIKKIF